MSDVSKPVPPVVSRAAAEVRRLGRNVNGYLGEGINIGRVLREIDEAARRHQWEAEMFLDSPRLKLPALHRANTSRTGKRAPAIYLSAGIHGDEPAGPLALLQLLQENRWPASLELWLCPCLNVAGFMLNRRENAEGLDLNRQYLEPNADETIAHIDWLKRQRRFDLCLCLHEDWESQGFYVYELNPDHQPSLAPAMVDAVKECCPIDLSGIIEGRPAEGGIIRPSLDPHSRPQWPESFYLIQHKTRHAYTLEAPSDFPLTVRKAALVTAVNAALGAVSAQS